MVRHNLRDIKINIIHFEGPDKKTALLHRFNAKIRVLNGDNKELFFNELHNAITFLLDHHYKMVIDI
jgi:hypothetical protein